MFESYIGIVSRKRGTFFAAACARHSGWIWWKSREHCTCRARPCVPRRRRLCRGAEALCAPYRPTCTSAQRCVQERNSAAGRRLSLSLSLLFCLRCPGQLWLWRSSSPRHINAGDAAAGGRVCRHGAAAAAACPRGPDVLRAGGDPAAGRRRGRLRRCRGIAAGLRRGGHKQRPARQRVPGLRLGPGGAGRSDRGGARGRRRVRRRRARGRGIGHRRRRRRPPERHFCGRGRRRGRRRADAHRRRRCRADERGQRGPTGRRRRGRVRLRRAAGRCGLGRDAARGRPRGNDRRRGLGVRWGRHRRCQRRERRPERARQCLGVWRLRDGGFGQGPDGPRERRGADGERTGARCQPGQRGGA